MSQEKTSDWALIIDDHPLFCDALELTLRAVSSLQNIATADCMASAMDTISARSKPSLIVLDLNLPDVSGLDGLVKLKAAVGPCPIIVVSSMCENAMISAALHAGASGFVPKHSRRAVFKEALQAVGNHEVYKPPGYVETPDMDDKLDTVERLASLTRQQTCILELICEGKLNKQIAYELSIAETTVKAHVTAIMRKLGVQSRTQAVLVAQQAKFSSVLPETE
ncbi:LuxR C-terminal-related transcriptional regulator [Marinibacterium profundimaris]|uniref:LuxR family transcriptional regulator n=1 Tax=Marinibacterium profundimaris TaxID=1679460 RepID=A0A225NS76_9RHOB|nr:response regulator transcription factor [Marinibacterium profundimaris]OWU77669.1 LuxR family transcriptional regulator [Marinibacterium profundimaris]